LPSSLLTNKVCLESVRTVSVSGRSERVVVCCLTTEVVKVVEPILFYEATRAHIIAYPDSDESDPDAQFFASFLDEAKNRIQWYGRTGLTVDHANVMDYQEMLRTIIRIIAAERSRCGEAVDIFVNISSGTPEYIAAAMLVAMQNRDVVAFSVRTKARSIVTDDAIRALSVDGRPVGSTSEVSEPTMVMNFGPEMPEDKFVVCLGVMKELNESVKPPGFADIINRMKEECVWDYVPESNKTRTDDSQKERMYFRRNFIDPMVEREWILEDPVKRNRYLLTEKGEAVVDVYGRD